MNEKDKAIIDSALLIIANHLQQTTLMLDATELVKNYLQLKLAMREREIFSVLYLDSQQQLIEYKEMFSGTHDGCPVFPKEIVKHAILRNSSAIIVAHNHPAGRAKASNRDIIMTQRIREAASLFDIKLIDHFIVARNEIISFSEEGLLAYI